MTTAQIGAVPSEENIFGEHRPVWHYPVADITRRRGAYLEHAASSLLNLLIYEYPGLQVFHSAEFDGCCGEVDTVLLYKSRVILIEVKNISENTYFTVQGRSKRPRLIRRSVDDKEYKRSYPGNRIERKIEAYKKRFPGLRVEAMYVFYGSSVLKPVLFGRLRIVSFEAMLRTAKALLDGAAEADNGTVKVAARLAHALKTEKQKQGLTPHAKRVLAAEAATAENAAVSLSQSRLQKVWNLLKRRRITST